MAEENENNSGSETPPPNNSGGETNAEKAAREQAEREQNEAEQRIKGWIKEGVAEGLKGIQVPSIQNPGNSSSSSEKVSGKSRSPKRKNALEKILGI